MATITESPLNERVETLLALWRSAALATQTDRNTVRRQNYQQAIASVCAEMPRLTSMHDLLTYYWSGQMQASAARASISGQGHVLNYQVVAAAACWQMLDTMIEEKAEG